jgi:predicted nucleic acid-binding protein
VPDCRDALDLPFMHLAVTGKAQVLVSGDRDLLAIAAEFARASSCPIMPSDVFCQTYCVQEELPP